MLKSLNLRRRGVTVISCPSCARQQFQVIKTVERLEKRLAHITTPLTVSVIGCVVNGPGEARETDIGFTGGGNGTHQVYISGLTDHRLKDVDIVDHLVGLVEKKSAELEAERRANAEPAKQLRRKSASLSRRITRGSGIGAEYLRYGQRDDPDSHERCDRDVRSLRHPARIQCQDE